MQQPLTQRRIAFYQCPAEIRDVDDRLKATTIDVSVGIATQAAASLTGIVMDELASMHGRLPIADLATLVCRLGKRCRSPGVHLEVEFPWPAGDSCDATSSADVVGTSRDISVAYEFETGTSSAPRCLQRLQVPVATRCPRSERDRCTHHQGVVVRVQMQVSKPLAISEIVATIDQFAVCEIDGLLKPEHDAPPPGTATHSRFVEEIAHEAYAGLRARKTVQWAQVRCESLESVHTYRGVALVGDPQLRVGHPGTTTSRHPANCHANDLHGRLE